VGEEQLQELQEKLALAENKAFSTEEALQLIRSKLRE